MNISSAEERERFQLIVDLGVARRSHIVGANEVALESANVRRAELLRASNIAGTKENARIQKKSEQIKAWNSLHLTLKEQNNQDDTDEHDVFTGQSHRLELHKALQKRTDVNSSGHAIRGQSGRGGRASRGGRGGGIAGRSSPRSFRIMQMPSITGPPAMTGNDARGSVGSPSTRLSRPDMPGIAHNGSVSPRLNHPDHEESLAIARSMSRTLNPTEPPPQRAGRSRPAPRSTPSIRPQAPPRESSDYSSKLASPDAFMAQAMSFLKIGGKMGATQAPSPIPDEPASSGQINRVQSREEGPSSSLGAPRSLNTSNEEPISAQLSRESRGIVHTPIAHQPNVAVIDQTLQSMRVHVKPQPSTAPQLRQISTVQDAPNIKVKLPVPAATQIKREETGDVKFAASSLVAAAPPVAVVPNLLEEATDEGSESPQVSYSEDLSGLILGSSPQHGVDSPGKPSDYQSFSNSPQRIVGLQEMSEAELDQLIADLKRGLAGMDALLKLGSKALALAMTRQINDEIARAEKTKQRFSFLGKRADHGHSPKKKGLEAQQINDSKFGIVAPNQIQASQAVSKGTLGREDHTSRPFNQTYSVGATFVNKAKQDDGNLTIDNEQSHSTIRAKSLEESQGISQSSMGSLSNMIKKRNQQFWISLLSRGEDLYRSMHGSQQPEIPLTHYGDPLPPQPRIGSHNLPGRHGTSSVLNWRAYLDKSFVSGLDAQTCSFPEPRSKDISTNTPRSTSASRGIQQNVAPPVTDLPKQINDAFRRRHSRLMSFDQKRPKFAFGQSPVEFDTQIPGKSEVKQKESTSDRGAPVEGLFKAEELSSLRRNDDIALSALQRESIRSSGVAAFARSSETSLKLRQPVQLNSQESQVRIMHGTEPTSLAKMPVSFRKKALVGSGEESGAIATQSATLPISDAHVSANTRIKKIPVSPMAKANKLALSTETKGKSELNAMQLTDNAINRHAIPVNILPQQKERCLIDTKSSVPEPSQNGNEARDNNKLLVEAVTKLGTASSSATASTAALKHDDGIDLDSPARQIPPNPPLGSESLRVSHAYPVIAPETQPEFKKILGGSSRWAKPSERKVAANGPPDKEDPEPGSRTSGGFQTSKFERDPAWDKMFAGYKRPAPEGHQLPAFLRVTKPISTPSDPGAAARLQYSGALEKQGEPDASKGLPRKRQPDPY